MTNTDVGRGEAERNPTGGVVSGRKVRDLNSITEVMLLAAEVADADARRATLLSLDEVRAIAKLAAREALVVHAAAMLLQASDDDLPKEHIAEIMKLLAECTRPFMGARE